MILNIASDVSALAPDQCIYRCTGLADGEQSLKPVSYSVIKAGLVRLTIHLATYWSDAVVRANALSPGGVQIDQPPSSSGVSARSFRCGVCLPLTSTGLPCSFSVRTRLRF